MRSKAFHFLVATSLLMHYSTTGRAGQLCVCVCTCGCVCAHARRPVCLCICFRSFSESIGESVFRGSFQKCLCTRVCVRAACVHAPPVIVCPLLSGVMIRLLPNRPGPSLWLLMCAQPPKARLSCRVRGGTWGIFLICLAKLIQPRAIE